MQLTIMTYNVERGFHSKNIKPEHHRMAAAKRAVDRVNPDVLALTEACYTGNNRRNIFVNYNAIFGFSWGGFAPFKEFGPHKGDEGGLGLISKENIEVYPFPLEHKAAVRAKINNLTIDVIHPSYSVDDKEKIRTLRPLIESRTEPYILTGDFNTVNPEDEYDWEYQRKQLMRFNPKKADWIVENWQQADFVKYLQSLGLKDAFPKEKRESTVPTDYVYGSPQSGVRMDLFFVSSGVKTIDAYVLKDEDTNIASDHYPIVGVFEIE